MLRPSVMNHPPTFEPALERAAGLIAGADAILVTAGAGMGVDSGLPDFRGPGGFWKSYPALGRRGIDFTTIASPAAFESMPRLASGFYGHRLALYRRVRPHEGFAILQSLGSGKRHGMRIFTSNVDGQFQKAGIPPGHVVECHGSIHHLQCLDGCGQPVWAADGIEPDVDVAAGTWRGALPWCPRCGGIARPNILMFGDFDWLGERYDRAEAQLLEWFERTTRAVVVELGAGIHIPSARRFGERTRCPLIRINPRAAEVSRREDVSLPLGAMAALQALVAPGRRASRHSAIDP